MSYIENYVLITGGLEVSVYNKNVIIQPCCCSYPCLYTMQ